MSDVTTVSDGTGRVADGGVTETDGAVMVSDGAVMAACDPFASPTTCASGQVCTAVFTVVGSAIVGSTFACVDLAMPVDAGGPCRAVVLTMTPRRVAATCGAELACISTASGAGQCVTLCTMEHPGCPSGGVCNPLMGATDVGACTTASPTCDPVAQTGCTMETACYLEYHFGPATAACLTPTDPSSAVAENGPCTGGGCAAGFTCYPDGVDAGAGTGHCRRFCTPGASSNVCAMATPRCATVSTAGTAVPVGVCLAM